MWYLFTQMWLWIIISFVLGWVANWYFCCRRQEQTEASSMSFTAQPAATPTPTATVAAVAAAPEVEIPKATAETAEPEMSDDWKPQGFISAPEDSDDLKRIKGIGAVNERALNGLGIYQFSQIAQWNTDNIKWVEGFLAFPGRVSREDWVQQAKELAAGRTTEFAKKVDDGEVDY